MELATKMEDINNSCVHTQGRSKLRPALPLQSEQKLTGGTKLSKLYRGSEIDQQAIRKAMKDGTNDCLNYCKKFNLDVFINETPFGETVEVQYIKPKAEDFSKKRNTWDLPGSKILIYLLKALLHSCRKSLSLFLYAVQHMITGMQMYVLQLRRFISDVFYK